MITDAVRRIVDSDAVAHLVTLEPDGSPHVSLAWIGTEADEIVIGTLANQRKLDNLRRDPRVALSIETPVVNEWGLREYLVLHGRARVTEGGGAALLQRLAFTYLGPGVKFPAMPNPPDGFVTRITVERIIGVGPWK